MGYDNESDGFDGYIETTVDPGPWLLLGTTVFCFVVMLAAVPLSVRYSVKRRRELQLQDAASEHLIDAKEKVDSNFRSIVAFDNEAYRILKLAIPYTVSALSSSVLSSICIILVSQYIGTNALTAYALTGILVGLTDGILYGPIYACTTLCAHAVGAGNNLLAGSYIQLAILFYCVVSIPLVAFWWFYLYDVILYLEWGDGDTALLAQEFIRVYIWTYLIGGISSALWQLFEVTDHNIAGTIIDIVAGVVDVIAIGFLVTSRESTLREVAWLYVATSTFWLVLTIAIAHARGWLQPFNAGLFKSLAIKNESAVRLMVKQSVPLAFGSLLSNAEWVVLTFFAAQMGPAEVAAWAIMGSIWEVFYSVTEGIGDASEIRVAFHLGDNHPTMAKLSAYKSLMLGMVVASVTSVIYFSLQNKIPIWFSQDEVLQGMLRELVPFIGVANLAMTFGMQCWSLVGAQGKYQLATWVSFVSSWGICMPLASIYVMVFNFDLQGLTSAVVTGYVSSGACLSYVLLSTDWYKVSRKIQDQNSGTASGKAKTEEEGHEEMYAALKTNSLASRAIARRNIRMVTLPSGHLSGLVLGNFSSRPGTYVLIVRNWSPFYGSVNAGDAIISLDGMDLTFEDANSISDRLKDAETFDRHMALVTSPANEFYDAEIEYMIRQVEPGETAEAFDWRMALPTSLANVFNHSETKRMTRQLEPANVFYDAEREGMRRQSEPANVFYDAEREGTTRQLEPEETGESSRGDDEIGEVSPNSYTVEPLAEPSRGDDEIGEVSPNNYTVEPLADDECL